MLLRDAVKNIEFVKSKALTYAKKVDDNIENVVYDVRLVQDLQNAIDLIEKNLPKLVKRA